MVLRRSTTRWTWPSDFKSAARSRVTFMRERLSWRVQSVHPCASLIVSRRGRRLWRGQSEIARAQRASRAEINGENRRPPKAARGGLRVLGA